jgi:hypothetical protein
MKTTIRQFAAVLTLACLPLVTGCGKDSPTAPKAAAPEYLDVTVTLVRLLAVADGDGIEGAGDFEYSAEVFNGQPTTLTVSGSTQLETGSTLALNKSRVIRVAKGDKQQIKVSFTGTEWDQNILGTVYADTRMDHLTEARTHTETTAAASFNDGERWITLGTGDLQFRLIYTISSKPV